MRHTVGEYVDGRYRICALLAQGGMTEVYRAVDTVTGNDVVFEYVEGESVRGYLKRHRPLTIDEVLRIGVCLADTLQYVHEQRVLHRDLKPDNIVIGLDGRITLMDFGIALRRGSRRQTFSHLSNAVGTPDYYMAPEQVRGEQGDLRTDVYALEAMRKKVETDPPLVRSLWQMRRWRSRRSCIARFVADHNIATRRWQI